MICGGFQFGARIIRQAGSFEFIMGVGRIFSMRIISHKSTFKVWSKWSRPMFFGGYTLKPFVDLLPLVST